MGVSIIRGKRYDVHKKPATKSIINPMSWESKRLYIIKKTKYNVVNNVEKGFPWILLVGMYVGITMKNSI